MEIEDVTKIIKAATKFLVESEDIMEQTLNEVGYFKCENCKEVKVA